MSEYFAGYDYEDTAVAVFKTEEERDSWVNGKPDPDNIYDRLYRRVPLNSAFAEVDRIFCGAEEVVDKNNISWLV